MKVAHYANLSEPKHTKALQTGLGRLLNRHLIAPKVAGSNPAPAIEKALEIRAFFLRRNQALVSEAGGPLHVLACFHDLSQARARWGDRG